VGASHGPLQPATGGPSPPSPPVARFTVAVPDTPLTLVYFSRLRVAPQECSGQARPSRLTADHILASRFEAPTCNTRRLWSIRHHRKHPFLNDTYESLPRSSHVRSSQPVARFPINTHGRCQSKRTIQIALSFGCKHHPESGSERLRPARRRLDGATVGRGVVSPHVRDDDRPWPSISRVGRADSPVDGGRDYIRSPLTCAWPYPPPRQ